MTDGFDRRDFLKWVGVGTAIASVPILASSCASNQATTQPGAAPAASAHMTYFDQFGVDAGVLKRTLEKGLSRGGDFCEIFLEHKVSHWLGMEDQAVNRAFSNVDLGAGIRVLKGDATGFAYCEDLTEQALLAAAGTAAAVADSTPVATVSPLAARMVETRYAIEPAWSQVVIDKKLPLVKRVDELARKRDKRILKVTVYQADESSRILVANSEGALVEDDQPMGALHAIIVAMADGKVETGYKSIALRQGLSYFTPQVIERLAHTVVDDTIALFGAVPAPVGELPVVLAPGSSGILLHEAIGHGMEADFNRKGTSIYANRVGKRIAPDLVTIVDDGTQPNLRGSINVDDEAQDSQRTVLVDKGILRSYMHDRISAKHYKLKSSTGSGRRQSFRFPPVPRMRATFMLDGPHEPDEIIAATKKGIYAEHFSNGQVNIGAGDFTFYLKKGRLIEDGKLTSVIKDANLIGSGPKVLEQVDMVANDLKIDDQAWTCGKDGQGVPVSQGLPTVRASGISIGGRKS
jgi:TldD protein